MVWTTATDKARAVALADVKKYKAKLRQLDEQGKTSTEVSEEMTELKTLLKRSHDQMSSANAGVHIDETSRARSAKWKVIKREQMPSEAIPEASHPGALQGAGVQAPGVEER